MNGGWFFPAVVDLCMATLVLSTLLVFVRLVLGPGLPDRVVALDLMTVLLVGIIALLMLDAGHTLFLPIAILVALISFLGTVAFAFYLERKRLK